MKGAFSVSELFDSYEDDFTSNYEAVKKSLDACNSSTSIEDRAKKFEKLQHHFQEAFKCLKQMEIEVTSIPPSYKGTVNNRVKICRNKYEALGKQFATVKEKVQIELQESNLYKDARKEERKADGTRDRLYRTGDQIIESGSHLDEINYLAADTHETALAVHGTLKKDGEMIVSASRISRNIEQELSLSQMVITSIRRREVTDKLILFLIIVVLFLLDCSVFYLKCCV